MTKAEFEKLERVQQVIIKSMLAEPKHLKFWSVGHSTQIACTVYSDLLLLVTPQGKVYRKHLTEIAK